RRVHAVLPALPGPPRLRRLADRCGRRDAAGAPLDECARLGACCGPLARPAAAPRPRGARRRARPRAVARRRGVRRRGRGQHRARPRAWADHPDARRHRHRPPAAARRRLRAAPSLGPAGAWTGFYALHTTSLGFPDTVPGLTWGLAVIAEIVLFFWGARLIERVAPPALILLALVLTAARWALTAAARSEPLVVALQTGHA